jgi:hypothetical protein
MIGQVITTKRDKDMTKFYLYQSIAFEPQSGYTMIPTSGEKNGAFNSFGVKDGAQLDYSASKVELGEKVINTLFVCQ